MDKKNIIIISILLIIVVAIAIATNIKKTSIIEPNANMDNANANIDNAKEEENVAKTIGTEKYVREIEIESFTDIIDGEYFPQFSKKRLTVKKGGKIRLKINTTSGKHDFKIDEFDVFSETPTGEITIIEFTPDKIGEFVYYCNKPRHRELGHWGTLIVTE